MLLLTLPRTWFIRSLYYNNLLSINFMSKTVLFRIDGCCNLAHNAFSQSGSDSCISDVALYEIKHMFPLLPVYFMVAADNYSVPLDLNIRLMVKPRRLSGVLLSIHSKQPGQLTDDYLVLQMVNGDVSSLCKH